jgi:hypothetical protein
MRFADIAKRTGRGLAALAFAAAAMSLSSPETAYARHNNGAAIALGILGGAIAGAAIASATAPGYYAAPPAYYYPYPLQAYPPGYYHRPPAAAYYGPQTYYGYYSNY